MIRDLEIKRLIKYAEGMGLVVKFKPYVRLSGTIAEWATDGTEITIFVGPRDSKLNTVLSLIHEIGHHKAFIAAGREFDPKVDKALDDEDEKKGARRKLYYWEVVGARYWEAIYNDTDCQFGLDRLNRQKEFDLWVYEMYIEAGEFPTRKEEIAKRKELRG